MARRATPVTKGRTTPKKLATPAETAPEAAKPARRSKGKAKDESPVDMLADDILAPATETPAPEADAPKPRRGRKSKQESVSGQDDADIASAAPDVEPPAAPELSAIEPAKPERPAPKAKAPKPASSPRTTRRNREPEASAPPPLDLADEPIADTPIASAVHWHSETDTVTFDWPAIEQVAATDGINQPMAKLLLAARAEGARSRWPF